MRRVPGPAAFLANLETEVLRLERELQAGTWQPGGYVSFEVHDPKRRLISAAPFRDLVVHHEVLKGDLRRRIACRRTLAVLDRIVDASNPQEPVHLYYSGDNLFTPYERRRGLPIGNLTSQLFANVYLDRFDHFVSAVLRAPYLRYVDDFALFADDPAQLDAWRAREAAPGTTIPRTSVPARATGTTPTTGTTTTGFALRVRPIVGAAAVTAAAGELGSVQGRS